MKTKRLLVRLVKATFILGVLLVAVLWSELALAANASPFVGHWQATDLDGSDIRLNIAGPPNGPFRITWTESYISFCEGEAGIVQGIGTLNESDPYLLEADLHVECFTASASLDFHLTFRYHPLTDNLSTRYENSFVTIWSRPGQMSPPPPELELRVNYGHDWGESFYEAGHTTWVTVVDWEGNVKATAELITEPKDFWGGETGFQTNLEDWDPAPPDIQPYDWVYGWVDNGASAQVQIGEINGFVNLDKDTVEGTINAPWLSDEVGVECHSWGAPLPEEILVYDTVFPNGEDSYTCSWADEWDIQAGQDVGVSYFTPDGHWVANALSNNARIVASESGNWLWTTDFAPNTYLDITLYESSDLEAATIWSGPSPDPTDESGFTWMGFEEWIDPEAGNYMVITDGITTKDLVLEPIAVTVFDAEADFMAGTAPAERWVLAAAGPEQYQEGIWVLSDPTAEEWAADFSTLFDFTEDMRGWSYAQIFDEDWDANEGSTPPANTWRDEFYGEFISGKWSWVNENPEMWNLAEHPGFLRLYASSGPVGEQNLLLRPPADGDFVIETRLQFEPDTNFQFAGLMIFQDEDNFLQVGRAFCDVEGACVQNGLYFDNIQDGGWVGSNFATQVESSSEVFLRLERIGDMITGFYSLDGTSWFEIGVHWLPYGFQINGVGLSAHADTNSEDIEIPADFDYFEMTDTED